MSISATEVESKTESPRERILVAAVAMARRVGLEGISIGSLAKEVGMSKAGLFAHFGSKEDLQLATFEAALASFTKRVLAPAEQTERGLPRLYQVISDWISLTECARDQGGCFFYAVSAEFDGRPGAVRDRLVQASNQWLEWIQRQIVLAKERGHLLPDVDEVQLAFEIHAFEQQANWASQLLKQADAFDRARISVKERLRTLATEQGKAFLDAAT